MTIVGHNDVLQYDDYYQSVPSLRSSGIGIGFWGDADNTIIRYSKIHDVGQCQAYDHLIYLSHGNNVQIYGNWLWNDPHGRGVQLYPAPTNARVFNNVIDHAGEGFVIGNETGDTVSGNQIYNNIITNSTGLPTEDIPGEAIHDLTAAPAARATRSTTTSTTATPAASAASPPSAPTTTRAPTRCSPTPPARLRAAVRQPGSKLGPLERLALSSAALGDRDGLGQQHLRVAPRVYHVNFVRRLMPFVLIERRSVASLFHE